MRATRMRPTWWLTTAIVLGGVVATGTAEATTSGTRTSWFAYDSTTGLLTQEVVEPKTSSLRLQTDYTYDAYGNKTSVTISGIDIATRASTSTYDPLGEFATTNTNALNQSESWQYDPRFGKPTSHTGPNGLTTTWSYDVYGRKIQEVRADGTQTQWQYLFCSGFNNGIATCPAGAVYLIQATPYASGGQTQNGPIGIVYYDTLDREIARDTQGFDGSTIRAAKQYDSFGNLQKQSRPYFASSGTPVWTQYQYDALNRVILETYPDSTTTQHAYHGLVTIDTNANNQTRTTLKNSQGNVVAVADAAGNTTTYAYDPFDKLTQTVDAAPYPHNTTTATYDVRGRKIASNDPDLGAWTYTYDTASELVSQTDAKSQTTTFAYDKLGRMTQRVEPDLTSTWTYDTAAYGIGKLAVSNATGAATGLGAQGFQRTFTYDNLSRPVQVGILIDSVLQYYFSASYDANSRLSTVTSPSGFVATYSYTSLGYSQQVSGGSQVYWTADARDAELRLTKQTAGNGVGTTQRFDPLTDRLTSILAGRGNTVENFSYTYDSIGNVLTRADANENLTETFTYDNLNRLLSATVSANVAPQKLFAYDPVGNLLSKSDVGTYTYPMPGSALPHAVSAVAGTINSTFTYDANGNVTGGLGRGYSYFSFNKPLQVSQGATYQNFLYDTEHARIWKAAPEGGTLYFDAFGVHAEWLSNNTWYDYISANGAMVAMRVSGASTATRYFHTDNLGSISVITNETGAVVERDGYDAWGKRRFPSGADDTNNTLTSQTPRGFTGQEELSDVGLVHLNGRIYDPLIARMTSADPMVPDPLNGQAWNRYSYVVNNPLAFTDPSGYCFLGLCGLGNAFNNLFKDFQHLLRDVPIVGTIIEVAAAAICLGAVVCAVTAAFLSTTAVSGIETGSFKLGLRAGLIAAATAVAFWEVGNLTMPNGAAAMTPAQRIENIAGHALVGCGQAVASGGKCGPSALAGGVTSAAGPVINGYGVVSLVANAAIGGGAAVLGGGKFENGAITAAFGYLFNELLHPTDLGKDAHQTLLNYAKGQSTVFFGNEESDPAASTWFGGRPDLGDTGSNVIWEVKTLWDTVAGAIQVKYYSFMSGVFGQQYDPSPSAPNFFSGSNFTLAGKFGFYEYTFVGGGVIGYTYNLYSGNFVVPSFVPLLPMRPFPLVFPIFR
jgi:RHS repeat-associated protein